MSPLQLSVAQSNQLRSMLFSEPRELGGDVVRCIEQVLGQYLGSNPHTYIEGWYRVAGVANYDSTEAAAAYLGAYAATSILKYQEALFALLMAHAEVPDILRIIDYGCGPCVGYAAVCDLVTAINSIAGSQLSVEYVGLDRSAPMLVVGDALCNLVESRLKCGSFELLETGAAENVTTDVLILSNVLNEGEGIKNAQAAFAQIVASMPNVDHAIIIEPATEAVSRQMCSIGDEGPGMRHIGPCPSVGAACTAWCFRTFSKRIYGFERTCRGTVAGVLSDVKYSLCLLSRVLSARRVAADCSVVIRRIPNSSRIQTCRHGVTQWRNSIQGKVWDEIGANGAIKQFP